MRHEWLTPGKYDLPPGHWLVIKKADDMFAVWWKTRTMTLWAVSGSQDWSVKVHVFVVGNLRYNTLPYVDTATLVVNGSSPVNNAVILPKR